MPGYPLGVFGEKACFGSLPKHGGIFPFEKFDVFVVFLGEAAVAFFLLGIIGYFFGPASFFDTRHAP